MIKGKHVCLTVRIVCDMPCELCIASSERQKGTEEERKDKTEEEKTRKKQNRQKKNYKENSKSLLNQRLSKRSKGKEKSTRIEFSSDV